MKKSPLTITLILFALFFAYTCACLMVDVAQFAPQSVNGDAIESTQTTDIGFQKLNLSVHNALGFRQVFYRLSEYIGYLALLAGACIGLIWLLRLIKTKKLLGVDAGLNAAIAAMALMVVFYVLFEALKLNFRPVILDDGLEASYPSSHTLLGCVVFGCAAMVSADIFKDKGLARSVSALCYIIAAVLTLFRALSGVHWISDIIGGVILSAAILSLAHFIKYVLTEMPEKQPQAR